MTLHRNRLPLSLVSRTSLVPVTLLAACLMALGCQAKPKNSTVKDIVSDKPESERTEYIKDLQLSDFLKTALTRSGLNTDSTCFRLFKLTTPPARENYAIGIYRKGCADATSAEMLIMSKGTSTSSKHVSLPNNWEDFYPLGQSTGILRFTNSTQSGLFNGTITHLCTGDHSDKCDLVISSGMLSEIRLKTEPSEPRSGKFCGRVRSVAANGNYNRTAWLYSRFLDQSFYSNSQEYDSEGKAKEARSNDSWCN